MNKSWKDLPLAPEKYELSTDGEIRSKTRVVACKGGTRKMLGKTLKLQANRKGYAIIGLSLNGRTKTYTLHQLMALTFIPNFVLSTEINHIDGDKRNNKITNLEVSDPSHNQLHAVSLGLCRKPGKSIYHNVSYISNPRAKAKWVGSVSYKGKSIGWKTFMTEIEAAHHVDAVLDSIGDSTRQRNFP